MVVTTVRAPALHYRLVDDIADQLLIFVVFQRKQILTGCETHKQKMRERRRPCVP